MVTVDQALTAAEALNSPCLSIQPEYCVQVRNRAVTCTACMDACPHGAILVEDNEIFTDPKHCTGCGACATACPTKALEATAPSQASLYANTERIAAESTKLAFCCNQAGLHASDDARFADVACLAQLDETLLAHAAIRGAHSIAFIDGGCETCINAKAAKNIEKTVRRFHKLCEFWGIKATLKQSTVEEAYFSADPSKRREALKELFGEAKDAALNATAKTLFNEGNQPKTLAEALSENIGNLKKRVPAQTVALANDLFEIEPRPTGTWRTRLFAQVNISSTACEHCGKCSFFCPTGALTQIGGPSQRTVMGVTYRNENVAFHEFRPSDCVRCGLCKDVCPHQAITLEDADIETLFELEPQTLP